ncbi:unnamed protein product [Echinostoma caproni]|uniref:Reverse transcriptase domain-containing protein n=1 Tax=Echinostoma caproni TaxID=27848 RepID=A0A183AA84_9TREM|nr:unnamed protein product [Echinostoma caproni]
MAPLCGLLEQRRNKNFGLAGFSVNSAIQFINECQLRRHRVARTLLPQLKRKVSSFKAVTGCQYRVTSDSGKSVKVYVTSASGTKCVTVTNGSTSETLCPSGTSNQFTSKEPIEISAEAEATTGASTAETTTSTIEPGGDSAGPNPDGSAEGRKEGGKSESGKKQQTDREGEAKKPQVIEKQPDNTEGDVKEQSPASPQQALQGPNVPGGIVPVRSKLIRRSRDTSNTDVIVYYVLGGDKNDTKTVKPGDNVENGKPEKEGNEIPDPQQKEKQSGDPDRAPEKEAPESHKQAAPAPEVQEKNVPDASALLRRARDISDTDVTVYYVLAWRTNQANPVHDELTTAQNGQMAGQGGNAYRQIDGVAMGSPLGPVLADLFMAHLVQKANNILERAILYKRYVDDTLVITESLEEAATTSGTKCVTVTSGDTSETLCPSGTNSQFTSQEPVEVSAELRTTTTAATPTEASTTETTTITTKPVKEPAKSNPEVSEKDKKKDVESDGEEKQLPESGVMEKQRPENSNELVDKQPPAVPQQVSPGKSIQEGSAPGSKQLLRRTRDTSSTDVVVYYVLDSD